LLRDTSVLTYLLIYTDDFLPNNCSELLLRSITGGGFRIQGWIAIPLCMDLQCLTSCSDRVDH